MVGYLGVNTLVSRGKSTDWMVHMIGQSVGACSNATHGMTLSAVSLPYYKMIMPYGVRKFARFAVNVWDISPDGKNEEELARRFVCYGSVDGRAWSCYETF